MERFNVHPVRTPEGVTFAFRLASPVLRLCAWVIDAMAVNVAWSVLSTALKFLALLNRDFGTLILIVSYFLLSHGYRIYTEYQWRGQTVGKKLFRLRVVDLNGHTLTFPQIAMRNLLRVIDALPLFYCVGGVAALFSRRSQRLGDLAAGTLVIWQPKEAKPDFDLQRSGKYNSLRDHVAVVARLRQEVTPAEANAAWQALARRETLTAEARTALYQDLAAHFRSLTRFPDELVDGISAEQFVRNVVDVLYFERR